ncbi:hypothetical protein AYO20_07896 [Fonsecaea nubica]|uniref:Uncharacterized protein n=1 Tax=Fonsecaea nubica TaxID=856822 RepID=A0A178CT10_9EURO|nr:hypothetical protein AYO20_07896 [Fonsecaea nubica]OAL32586.1 hypothetical protein AYO20_07896 [Fonsecaea nubica]
MPKFVRRQPLAERIKGYLNPYDFLLWLSEELESNGWDQLEKEWAAPIGIALNVIFVIARANSKSKSTSYDDVFGDIPGVAWTTWLATFIVHFLTLFCTVNATYTFWRKRHYRLFETSVDDVPSTPSAKRVRVDSSPVSSSPLQYLSRIIGTESARSRAHPDPTRDVWEVAVWDPLPISLRLFCYFSPGHILVYWLFLPTLPSDPRPSVTIATAMFVAMLLSAQLSLLQLSYSAQVKDSALISKEVLHEYDTKYVRPRTQPLYRDVGTQFSEQASYSASRDEKYNKVDVYTPMVVINRGFRPNPNPNYAQYTDPDTAIASTNVRQRLTTPDLRSPIHNTNPGTAVRPLGGMRQPNFRPTATGGEGGSLGVYSHAASPLRKMKRSAIFYADGIDDRQPQHVAERSAEGISIFDEDHRSQRGFHSYKVKTVPELDAVHDVSSRLDRRNRGFLDDYSVQKVKKGTAATATTGSEMHRFVNSDDYLLARGANPRTGVVTPGSHSASGSVDRNQNDLSRIGSQVPSSRWRQRGDQWVSLGLDEPTPQPTSLIDEPLEHQYQPLRVPQKLATQENRDSLLDHGRGEDVSAINLAYVPGENPYLHQKSLGVDVKEDVGVQQANIQDGITINRPIKRKPVGSPPAGNAINPGAHPQRGTSGSTDTVRRNPIFSSEVRFSSAPDIVKGRLFRPYTMEKTLPKIPTSSSDTASQTGESPFLGVPQADQQVDCQNSKISNISGHHTVEKELPCLPTNNGQSWSIPEQTPYPITPEGVKETSMTAFQSLHSAPPKGPRASDFVHPHGRRRKPMYPIAPEATRLKPMGERVMPIPEYDNPPKLLLPSTQTCGLKVEGPRAPPLRGVKPLNGTRQNLNPLSNITTMSTDISMDARRLQRPSRPLRQPQPPDYWIASHGQQAFHPKPLPLTGTDTIMNNNMNPNADAFMPVPMPRIRPREAARPPLLTREEMYWVPRIVPISNQPESRDVKTRQMLMSQSVEPGAGEHGFVTETSLMPKPLKLRLQPFQGPVASKDTKPQHAAVSASSAGLKRKCSHCNQDVKLLNSDSVTPMSALQKDVAKASVGTKRLHPNRSPLPELRQDVAPQQNAEAQKDIMSHLHDNVNVVDERDHTICCPECCKQDCHEGCLGHPSPTWPSSGMSNLYLDAQGPISSSDLETQDHLEMEKPQERGRFTRLADLKPVLKRSHKEEEVTKSGNYIQAALSKAGASELTMHPPTPSMKSVHDSVNWLPGAVAAAVSAMEPPWQKRMKQPLAAAFGAIEVSQHRVSAPRPAVHRRKRSSSLPIIGTGVTSRPSNRDTQYLRAASGGSRLRVTTPLAFAMACSKSSKDGHSKSRNVSGASSTTIELQVPNLLSLGSYGSCVLIPLQAGQMWIRNHPQIVTVGKEMGQRCWAMAQLMTKTGWRLWAMMFVYSKTGKIKFHVSKGETAGGFVLDMGRSLLYLIIFAALSTLAMRVLGMVAGLLGIIAWIVRTVFWVLKGILGVAKVK